MTPLPNRRWIPPWLNDTERAHVEALDAAVGALDASAALQAGDASHTSVMAAISARFASRRVLGPFELGTTTAARRGALRVDEAGGLTHVTDDLQAWVGERAAAMGWTKALQTADPQAAGAILRALHTELVLLRLVQTETEYRNFRVALLPASPAGPADFVQVEFGLGATRIRGQIPDPQYQGYWHRPQQLLEPSMDVQPAWAAPLVGRAVDGPRYSASCVLDIGRFAELASRAFDAKHARTLEHRVRYTEFDAASGSQRSHEASIGERHPQERQRRERFARWCQAWEATQADVTGPARGLPMAAFWTVDAKRFSGGEGGAPDTYEIIPQWVWPVAGVSRILQAMREWDGEPCRDEENPVELHGLIWDRGSRFPPRIDQHEQSDHELMAALERFDTAIGRPGAWFFFALHGNRIGAWAIERVADAIKSGRIRLPGALERAVLEWDRLNFAF